MTRDVSEAAQSGLVEAHIKQMVQRFLGWKLPSNFNPDNGISFDPIANKGHAFESKREPVGTNLLSADQATEMVRYMVEGLPVSESQPADRLLADIENREARRQEILDWLQEKIGTAWECDQCGYQTYHSSSNECAECGKSFPTLHLLAFKLHASHTDAPSHAPSQPAPVVDDPSDTVAADCEKQATILEKFILDGDEASELLRVQNALRCAAAVIRHKLCSSPQPDRKSEVAITPKGFTLVPTAAISWLMGEFADERGVWFGEEEESNAGKHYWWRAKFRRMIESVNRSTPSMQTEKGNG